MELFNVHLISINLKPLMRLTDDAKNNSISSPYPEGNPCKDCLAAVGLHSTLFSAWQSEELEQSSK